MGEDLVVEQHPVGAPGARLEVCGSREPAFGPLVEDDLALGWVDVGAAQLGILDADQEPPGVGHAVEAALALPPARVAPARPVSHPAGLDAALDVAHPRRPFCPGDRNPRRRASFTQRWAVLHGTAFASASSTTGR